MLVAPLLITRHKRPMGLSRLGLSRANGAGMISLPPEPYGNLNRGMASILEFPEVVPAGECWTYALPAVRSDCEAPGPVRVAALFARWKIKGLGCWSLLIRALAVEHEGRRAGMRSVLARPGYRRLWAARTVSQWGDVAQFTTLALLVFHLTGRGLGVSGVVVAEIVPVVLLAPVAGLVADRLPRVRVMIAADLARLVLAAVLAVAHGSIIVVYVLAFGLSAGSVFFSPAAGSLLPALVAEGELVTANTGIWSAAVLSQVAVAPAAGVLAAAAGYGWGFAVNSASFAVSAILLARLRSAEASRPVTVTSIWAQSRETASLLARDRLLRALAAAQALAALSAGATSALLVVLASRRLHVSGGGYGLLLSAIAVGAFAGPLLLTRLLARLRQDHAVFAAFGLRSLVDATLATVTVLPAALAALVFYGLGTSSGNVSFSSLIQSHVPASLRGRILSAFDLIWHTMRLASLLIGGVAADVIGIRAVYYAGAVLLAAAALSGLTATRSNSRESFHGAPSGD